MSRRLTQEERVLLCKTPVDRQIADKAAKILGSNEDSEFYEGVAAGLLLAFELLQQSGGQLNQENSLVIKGCIQESLSHTN